MEIRLVLVLEDTNDLSVDMPTVLESSYRPRETHKLVLVAMGIQSVRFEKNITKGRKARTQRHQSDRRPHYS